MLHIKNLEAGYGKVQVLHGISLEVPKGQVVTLIGSNGAGKSTTLRSISALTPARRGTIRFSGTDITNSAPQDIVSMGMLLGLATLFLL